MNFHQTQGQFRNHHKSKTMTAINKKKSLPIPVPMKSLKKTAREGMVVKYLTDVHTFSKKIITDIIYNEKSHIVAKFKDFLIYDDLSEFLKRYYRYEESYLRLPKIIDYYENYSKIFPNYIMLSEAKYIYKNIQKKQKMIDNHHKYENEKKKKVLDEDNVFNTDIYESIMNQTETQSNNKENSLNGPWNVTYNPQIGEKVHVFQLENSYSSIERLIDNIGEAEKTIPGVEVKSIVKRNEINENADNFVSPPISHRDRPNKVLSPIITKAKEAMETGALKKNVEFGNKFKTIEVNMNYSQKTMKECSNGRTNGMNKGDNSNINNKLTESILNKLKGENSKFESNLLQKKYKEIKNRNRLSSDITNITALKDKIKRENGSALFSANQVSNFILSKGDKTLSSSINKYGSNNEERPPESARTRKDSEMNSNNSNQGSNNLSKKNSVTNLISAGGKTTNNIFYIINQNPQVNAQITIVNNNPNTISTEQPCATSRNILNTKMIFKASEKNNFKKLQNLKPEIYNSINKNKNQITTKEILSSLKGIKAGGTDQSNNNNQTNSKTIFAGSMTSRGSGLPTSNKIPIYAKNENRDSTPGLTARQAVLADSMLKNHLSTINYEENSLKSSLYDKYLNKGHGNGEKKGITTAQKIRKISNEREASPVVAKVKKNNFISPITNKMSTITTMNNFSNLNIDNKISISPNRKFAHQNSMIPSYTHHIKSTTAASFKPSPIKPKDSTYSTCYGGGGANKQTPKGFNNPKLNQAKGIPIKNFKELITQNTITQNRGFPKPNSDRTHSIKVDRLNKIK